MTENKSLSLQPVVTKIKPLNTTSTKEEVFKLLYRMLDISLYIKYWL